MIEKHTHTAVVSSMATDFTAPLKEEFDVIMLSEDKLLAQPVRCHPDMILFSCGCRAVLPRNYAEAYPDTAEKLRCRCGLEITESTFYRGEKYPFDIALNVLTCGGYAFSLRKHTASEVLEIIDGAGLEHVSVRQGYAACSSLALDQALITADPSIANAAESVGIDVLHICGGHIRLDGYNEGFIGGASGVCGKKVYFLGNIMTHPDGKNIREFIVAHGYEVICLGEGELCDFGGIRFFENAGSAF